MKTKQEKLTNERKEELINKLKESNVSFEYELTTLIVTEKKGFKMQEFTVTYPMIITDTVKDFTDNIYALHSQLTDSEKKFIETYKPTKKGEKYQFVFTDFEIKRAKGKLK